jgi:uncharacterized protein YegP (UPF0339 family)
MAESGGVRTYTAGDQIHAKFTVEHTGSIKQVAAIFMHESKQYQIRLVGKPERRLNEGTDASVALVKTKVRPEQPIGNYKYHSLVGRYDDGTEIELTETDVKRNGPDSDFQIVGRGKSKQLKLKEWSFLEADQRNGFMARLWAKLSGNKQKNDTATAQNMSSKMAVFELYIDKAGEYRWRLKAANKKIIADSAEGYSSRQNAQEAIDRVKAYVRGVDVEEITKE